jgi:hypothetical protein
VLLSRIVASRCDGRSIAVLSARRVVIPSGGPVRASGYGATLGLKPLVVLIVTIAVGSLFGMIGLVLAAPLTSAGVPPLPDVGEPDPVAG